MDRNELSLEPRHPIVQLGASKIIFKPMVRLAQTMRLSCTNIKTVSKLKEATLHMSHITLEFHRVHPKQFLSLMVHSVQTVHISCIKISTIFKQTESAAT
jgi:hypothetical protein